MEPKGVNIADVHVHFLSTMAMTDWDSGKPDSFPIKVDSRPSLLYRQLFGGSLGGMVTSASQERPDRTVYSVRAD